MNKKIISLAAIFLISGTMSTAQASNLTIIGTATYQVSDNNTALNPSGANDQYNLIYDADLQITWLDFTSDEATWAAQNAWATGLGSELTVNLNQNYTTDIDWTTGWRLPSAGVTPMEGYNQRASEMGHLFYDELGNVGAENPDGSTNPLPPGPDFFLQNTGDFTNLIASIYWTDQLIPNMYFDMFDGGQWVQGEKDYPFNFALAVHSGEMSTVPIPGAVWLFGSGLAGLFAVRRKKNSV